MTLVCVGTYHLQCVEEAVDREHVVGVEVQLTDGLVHG